MPSPSIEQAHGVFCNRTLNLRRIRAVGYDMDYTLVHYEMRAWEARVYAYIREKLAADGWPVHDLAFDPDLASRGLILDTETGNTVKANRFGYVKRAAHGTRRLSHEEQRDFYLRTLTDLSEERWIFLNTLFAISEAAMYAQLVDLLDEGALGTGIGYRDLYVRVRSAVDNAHMEGRLKAEILADPSRFVVLDPAIPQTLLDQKDAGKKVLLITNSEWGYTDPILRYAFDPFLPDGMTWRDLFDIAIVGARKPAFFTHRMPTFDVVSEDGLLREHVGPLQAGHVYVGANAALVEASLGLRGEDLLYVGDHLFTDVNVSKSVLRWRTALILRELEEEFAAAEAFEQTQERLTAMMDEKIRMEGEYSAYRLALQRARNTYGPGGARPPEEIEADMAKHREKLLALDAEIAPLARASAQLHNPNWGLMMRTGNDKSHLARQVERYADVYTGRVSNFLHATPYAYLRSHRGSLPHDPA